MNPDSHYRLLEKMYLSAPINAFFKPKIAISLEEEFFVLTAAFTTYLTRLVSEGKMKSIGRVLNKNKTQIIAESVVYGGRGRAIGRGNGLFVRGKTRLSEVKGYGDG